jgi:hypothetical protein
MLSKQRGPARRGTPLVQPGRAARSVPTWVQAGARSTTASLSRGASVETRTGRRRNTWTSAPGVECEAKHPGCRRSGSVEVRVLASFEPLQQLDEALRFPRLIPSLLGEGQQDASLLERLQGWVAARLGPTRGSGCNPIGKCNQHLSLSYTYDVSVTKLSVKLRLGQVEDPEACGARDRTGSGRAR